MTVSRAVILSALIPIAMAVLLAPFTPAVAGNGGPTSDGVRYAAVVAALRGGTVPTEAPYVYRILPAAIVAALPMATRDAFLLLNGLATTATGPLLYAFLRRQGAASAAALLGVVWWAALPTTVRYTIHYPATLDAIGLALLLALLLLADARRYVAFAVLLAASVLVRENTLVVSGFLWVVLLPEGVPRATLRAGLATLPGVLLLVWVHVAPPVPPTMWWTQYDLVLLHLHEMLFRAEVPARYLLSIPLSLGLFALVPIVGWRASAALLRRRPALTFYIVATLAIAAIGGLDHDRFMVWLVPAVGALTFASAARWMGGLRNAAILTALHLLAVRWLWPIDSEGKDLLVASMDPALIAVAAGAATAAAIGTWLILRSPMKRGSEAAVAT